MTLNPLDSIDLDELLRSAIAELARAKDNAEASQKRNSENVGILETVVNRLNHIKDRRLKDSGIIH